MWKKIKEILKLVKQYKIYAILTPIFMLVEALLECVLPYVMSIFVDAIESIKSPADILYKEVYVEKMNFNVTLMGIIIILVIMAMISLAAGILGGLTAAKASCGLAANLRSAIYKKIQSFSFGNIDKFSTSSLVTRLTTDIMYITMAFQMLIRIVVRAPLMMIFSAIMAFISGGTMAWIFIILIPVVGIALGLIVYSAMKVFRVVFKRYDKLNESVQENVAAIRVVKAFVREDYEKKKFVDASNGITREFTKGEKIVALNNPILNTAIHLSNIFVVAIGTLTITKTVKGVESTVIDGKTVYTILWGKLSIGQMSSLLTYGIAILTSVLMISMIMVMLVLSIESIRRVGEVLEEESTIKNPENPIYELNDGSVRFNNVNFKYAEKAERNTLESLNIDIKSGQFVGIIGATGSGKTSVVNLISRLYDVSEGEIIVAGHNVKEYDLKTLRDNVAVVLQKNVLFTGTIADNLRWGDLNATDEELVRAAQIAQADEFVQSFPDKYNTQISQGGTNVSGGQKQRLCIARAILKKPKILILDDSTSAVDTKTDRLIRKGLKEDLPEMTKIVIAQRISSIEDADQIIILDNGKIDAIGDHKTLLANNKIYQDVYYTQNKVNGKEAQ